MKHHESLKKFYLFTTPELDKFRRLCNFTDEEEQYLNLNSRGKSNVEIAFAMNISESKVSKLARRVKDKVLRVI